MYEVSNQKNNLDCHAPFGRSQGRADPSASRKMTFWDERPPPLQEKWRFETSGPLRFKKNDVLGQAAPSASRKTTFWDERTSPLQEKRRFRTSGPLRFKKNDVLGRADPSASLLQSGNFKIYSFFICLLNEKMTSITKIKAIALTKLNNAEYGAFMDSWKIKKNPEGCSGSFFLFDGGNTDNAFLKINLASF